MLGSGPSVVQGGSGAMAPLMIPMRFVWPYGGRRVFLCGSFTRWLEHIPMMPVEGCPSVFQVIYSLTPGYHQYKFFVDGEWRHDECQPFVTGDFGVVNTIFIGGEPEMPSPSYAPVTPTRSLMDVDNGIFLHGEASPRISETDLQISRKRISTFLSSHAVYELLPDSGKVVALDVTLPVKQAFHILYGHGIPLAPLWDCSKGQLVGVLSALDFILILRELGTHGSNLTEEELETHTIAAWKEGKRLHKQMAGGSMSYAGQLIHAGPFDSLKDVTLKILQHKVSAVPIIHSSSPDGSFPDLLHLASLSEILKCICRYFKHSASSLPVLQQAICSLPLGTWLPNIGQPNGRPIAMLRSNASLSAALSLLLEADVSSIPIVDDNNSLLDIYSRSDITSLAKARAYAMIHLDGTTIHQALQLGQDVTHDQRCQMCLRTDSLHKVMERLSNPGVRRVVVVEAGSKRVEGVISLSDVFRFLLG